MELSPVIVISADLQADIGIGNRIIPITEQQVNNTLLWHTVDFL